MGGAERIQGFVTPNHGHQRQEDTDQQAADHGHRAQRLPALAALVLRHHGRAWAEQRCVQTCPRGPGRTHVELQALHRPGAAQRGWNVDRQVTAAQHEAITVVPGSGEQHTVQIHRDCGLVGQRQQLRLGQRDGVGRRQVELQPVAASVRIGTSAQRQARLRGGGQRGRWRASASAEGGVGHASRLREPKDIAWRPRCQRQGLHGPDGEPRQCQGQGQAPEPTASRRSRWRQGHGRFCGHRFDHAALRPWRPWAR